MINNVILKCNKIKFLLITISTLTIFTSLHINGLPISITYALLKDCPTSPQFCSEGPEGPDTPPLWIPFFKFLE